MKEFQLVAGALEAIAYDGPYKSGCAELEHGIWTYLTEIGSPNRFIRLYVFHDKKRVAPLHGCVTMTAIVDAADVALAEARLNRTKG